MFNIKAFDPRTAIQAQVFRTGDNVRAYCRIFRRLNPFSFGTATEKTSGTVRNHFLILTAVLATSPTFAPHAIAQNAAWINPSGGFYEEPNNWVPSAVPGAGNDVLFNVAGTYTVALQSSHSANSLLVPNNVDLSLSSGGPGADEFTYTIDDTVTINSASLTLGDLTQGRLLHVDAGDALNMAGGELSLLNGAQLNSLPSLSNSNTIEGGGGLTSQIEVRGTDPLGQPSRWETDGGINIGHAGGSASLTIADGGQVSSLGSLHVGTNVSASGSLLVVRGTAADGTPSSLTGNVFNLGLSSGGGGGLSIATAQVVDGAMVSTGNVQVRRDSRITIEGEDAGGNPSRWEAGTIDFSGGFLDLEDGAQLTTGFANLNRLAIARVNGTGADGRPSRWDINATLQLGSANGFGSLLIDGGHVTSNVAQIGMGTGSSLFRIEGVPSAIGVWENAGDAFVGGSSTGPEASGELRMFDDYSQVDIGGRLTVWETGSVEINGGELKAVVIDHVDGGDFNFNAGTLRTDRFNGNLQNVAGTFTPGVDQLTGSTLINGNYTQQSGGALAFDIGGTGPGSTYDLVDVNGDANIDGLLELTLTSDFTPTPLNQFTLLDSDSLIGFFDNVSTGQRLSTTDGRGSFAVHYGLGSLFDETRIILTDFEAAETLPGDYNDDGSVDAADYTVWRNNLGSSVTLPGDLSPGDVSMDDYGVWKSNFGSSAAPAALTPAQVPEPATAWLALSVVGVTIVGTSRRVRGHRRWRWLQNHLAQR